MSRIGTRQPTAAARRSQAGLPPRVPRARRRGAPAAMANARLSELRAAASSRTNDECLAAACYGPFRPGTVALSVVEAQHALECSQI